MKIENTNMNIPVISVTELVKQLTALYAGAIEADVPFSKLPSPFLWGAAGIGKSDGVKQLAQALELKTGKKVVVTDVRLLLFSPVDLRGVPVADEHRRFTDWLKPRIFDMDSGKGTVNILFLDELSAAPQSVQASAYQITLDKKVGEHSLPDNTIVIAAGNRTTDQSVSYKMPKALCNRLMHYCIQSDYGSWKLWALKHGIDRRIIGYLAFDNSKLCEEPESGDLAYPTPRSWTFASNIIKTLGSLSDLHSCHSLISACIGTDTAVAFEEWCRIYETLPSVEEIMRGGCRNYPKTQDALFALTASLTSSIITKSGGTTLDELENVCEYACRFPADFAMSFFKDLNSDPAIKLLLMKCRTLNSWLAANKTRM